MTAQALVVDGAKVALGQQRHDALQGRQATARKYVAVDPRVRGAIGALGDRVQQRDPAGAQHAVDRGHVGAVVACADMLVHPD
jgi:hypothetical protein